MMGAEYPLKHLQVVLFFPKCEKVWTRESGLLHIVQRCSRGSSSI